MPYIKKLERQLLDGYLQSLLRFGGLAYLKAGCLNYIITKILHAFVEGANYERLNAAIGVLESAKLELYRRVVAPYEDAKIKENGDI